MKWDIQAIMARADKAIELKHKMLEIWPDADLVSVDRFVFSMGFQDAFREGSKSARPQPSEGYSDKEVMIFAKYARDYKSAKDIQACFETFKKDRKTIMDVYKLK